jgi:prepilin-type processing-associated H-X9-DG protein
MPELDSILKTFERPDEVRSYPRGRFEIVRLRGLALGRAIHEPGWRWSVDVGAVLERVFSEIEHAGLVLAGRATVSFADGHLIVLEPGMLFHVSSKPHDSWVVGTEPYVSIYFLGVEAYARR